MNIPDEEVKEIYDDFVMRHRSLCRLCTEQVKQLAADVFDLNRKDDAAAAWQGAILDEKAIILYYI